MKPTLLALLFVCCSLTVDGQNRAIDSLWHVLTQPLPDTSRTLVLAQLCELYHDSNLDSAFLCGQQALTLAQRIRYGYGETKALQRLARVYRVQGNLPKAMSLQMSALKKAEQLQAVSESAAGLFTIATIYLELKEYDKALHYGQQAHALYHATNNEEQATLVTFNLVVGYRQKKRLDSALIIRLVFV